MSILRIGRNILLGVALTLFLSTLSTSGWAAIFNPATGHWYDLVNSGTDGSWVSAENNAVALGGHLVTINDASEEAWLRSTFGNDILFWIGFTDSDSYSAEGMWVWSSGEPVSYTHWDFGEPNDAMPPDIGEDYAVINWDISTGAWNDWDHRRPDYIHSDGSPYMASGIAEFTSNPVPEPGALLLLGVGLVGIAGHSKIKSRRRKRA